MPSHQFTINSVHEMRNRPRNTRGEISEVRFVPLEEVDRPDRILESLVEQLFARVLDGRPQPMLIGLQLHPPTFENPFTIALRPPEQNNAAAIADYIQRLNDQSAAGIDLTAGTTLTKVLAVWPLEEDRTETGREGGCNLNGEHVVTHRVRSLIRINNPNDRFCLARSILFGIKDRRARIIGGSVGTAVYKDYAKRQRYHGPEAQHLLIRAGIPTNKHMYTLEDVHRLQEWINEQYGEREIRLVVFEKEREHRIVFKGDVKAAKFNLCILLENAHFNYIGRVEQVFRCPQYCIDCERRVTRWYHPQECKVYCRFCLRYGADYPCQTEQRADGTNTNRICHGCLFVFPNDDCYNYHRANRAPPSLDGRGGRQHRPICEWRRSCRFCGRITYGNNLHNCRTPHQPGNQCIRCQGPHTTNEPCFIQPLKDRELHQRQGLLRRQSRIQQEHNDAEDDDEALLEQPVRYCLFDAETSQDQPLQLHTKLVMKHIPLLIVAEVICEACIRANISVHDGVGRRGEGCVCATPTGPRGRRWCTPPFQNGPDDNTLRPANVQYNPRRMFFHSFDDPNVDPADEFEDFLLNTGPQNIQTICLSHNGGKYDMHLILEALHRRNLPPKRMCTTGLKIYSMNLSGQHQRHVTFKDTLNFFFCPLDALPKAFEVPTEIATPKPFFPYMFIRRENLLRRLNGLPDQEFYQPDDMKSSKRDDFIRWHTNEATAANFQLREQLILYCMNDVAILRESVLRFRQLIAEHTNGLDPFLISSTGAGLAMSTLRRCFLPPNKLVNTPEGGYLRGRRCSAESARYIRLYEMQNPEVHVQSAQWSIGEARVDDSGYRLDGLVMRAPPLRPLAIEYMGCYYHGCPTCFSNNRQQKLAGGRSAEELFERTQRRLYELEHQHGYSLHVIWGCELKQRLRVDPELRRLYNEAFVPRPLDPRDDALRGGRTEPFALHHNCSADEEIVCIDIVSLYPYAMKAFPFPVGNPRILTRETLLQPPTPPLPWQHADENPFKGLLFVRVLPPDPSSLRVPLLPYRTHDGRLTFPLCARCAENRQQRPCRHNSQMRSWATAYTHVEINKALQLGYKIIDLFEVWDYEHWDGDLFRGYVDTFVGLKVQASGWPAGCSTDEQRRAYIDEFEQTEGIRLNPDKISNNPAVRMITKILANSLYGKTAQRVGRTEVRYTRSPHEFHALLENQTLDIIDFHHVSPYMDRVVVRKKSEFAVAPSTNCLPVAIFVTSYARLRLYYYLEEVQRLGHKLLYCDTDSIYYVAKAGCAHVSVGEALGQMKRERVDRRIFEFICGGPKNYGFRHCDRTTGGDLRAELKVRSFRISYAAHQLLNFETMKAITLEYYNIDGNMDDILCLEDVFVFPGSTSSIRVTFPQIGRTPVSDVYTDPQARKDYRPHYEKGRIRPGMKVLPYGFRE